MRVLVALTTINFGDLTIYGSVVMFGTLHLPLYHETLFTYPPLWGYYFLALGRISELMGTTIFRYADVLLPYQVRTLITSTLITPFSLLLIKLPALLCDGLVTWQIVRILEPLRVDAKTRWIAALAWWLNPAVIFTSSVQAGWDCAIVASGLGCAIALRERRALEAGMWIALGVGAKLIPLFFIPIALASLVRSRESWRGAWTSALLFGLGFAAIVAILMAPVAAWHELQIMRGSIFARGGMPVVGGYTIFALSQIAPFAWLKGVFISNPSASANGVLFFNAVAAIFGAFLALRARGDRAFVASVAMTIVLLAIMISSPFIQPSYYVWVAATLPLAALRATDLRMRRLQIVFAWIGAFAAFAFLMTIRLPQGLLLPACYFMHLCNTAAFAHQNMIYNTLPGSFTPLFQVDIDVLLGIVGGASLIGTFALLTTSEIARLRVERAHADA